MWALGEIRGSSRESASRCSKKLDVRDDHGSTPIRIPVFWISHLTNISHHARPAAPRGVAGGDRLVEHVGHEAVLNAAAHLELVGGTKKASAVAPSGLGQHSARFPSETALILTYRNSYSFSNVNAFTLFSAPQIR